MKKKYYFNSFMSSFVYVFIALPLFGYTILCFFADQFHLWLVIVLIFLISIILFWVGFSFSMRIEINFEKHELYIRHPYFLKRIKFDDVISIEIKDYNEVAFDFVIETNTKIKKLAYARYYKKKPSLKITKKLNELKSDLRKICFRNY